LLAGILMLFITSFYGNFFRHTVTETPQANHVRLLPQEIYLNLIENTFFFLKNNAMPLIVTILSVTGVIICFVPSFRLERKKWYALLFGLWFALYFMAHLMSSSGGYDIDLHYDTVRYSIDFAVPIFILTSLGTYGAYSLLPRNAGKPFLAVIVLLLILTPAINHRAIVYDSSLMAVTKDFDGEISNYPSNTVFYTNMYVLYNSLILDYHLKASLVESRDALPKTCGPDNKCVFVLFTTNLTDFSEKQPELFESCYSKFLYNTGIMTFCPLEKAAELPERYYKTLELGRCCI
jgi:hypothetical protein